MVEEITWKGLNGLLDGELPDVRAQMHECRHCSLKEASLLKLVKVMLVLMGQKTSLLKVSMVPWSIHLLCSNIVKTLQLNQL